MVKDAEFLAENNQEISPGIIEPEGEPYLRLYVPSGSEFAFPAIGIRDLIQHSPDRITPIPNASPLLLGTMNLRGQVIWVADLGQFLGDMAVLNTDQSELEVIAVEDQDTILGLAVERLGEMDWFDLDDLQMPTDITDTMAPFVKGEWQLNGEEKQHLRLLDQFAILRSARWAA
jgi:twitching motility protein PilI